jgi:peptidyl-prolyl cis-trans isomerase C
MLRKGTKLTALLALTTLAWAGAPDVCRAAESTNSPAKSASSSLFDDVVAKGKGVEVRRGQLDSAMVSVKASVAARGQSLPPEQMNLLEQQVLEQLVRLQLLQSQATEADKAAGQKLFKERLENIKTRAGSEETLNRQIKSVGLTMPELEEKLLQEATAEAVVERELKVEITDKDIQKFYDENPARFEQPEMVRASHVLIGAGADLTDEQKKAKRATAEEVLKKARAGEDFAKLAKEYSDDPGSKDKGGEYTFPKGQMVPEFEAAAFSLKTNEVSDIVTTQFGYHIIKLSEKLPARKEDLAKVKDKVGEFLKQEKIRELLPEYIAKLRKNAAVEILDPKLQPKADALDLSPAPPKADEKKADK